jgi:hypothetical protein
MPKREEQRAVKAAYVRSLEKRLAEERLAIAAIVKVMLLEVPDPARVLARLEAMTRAAAANTRTPASVTSQLMDATRFVRTAIQRELGKPQELFEPHVGHVRPADVQALVEPTEGPQQLGLLTNESIEDAEDAHAGRIDTISKVYAALIEILRNDGAMTDRELHAMYEIKAMSGGLPRQSFKSCKERRMELKAAGRLKSLAEQRDGDTVWELIERNAT